MTVESAAQFLEKTKQDQELIKKLKAADNLDICVKIAEEYGYTFTTEELETGLSKLSPEELAALVNPGVGTRIHIDPR